MGAFRQLTTARMTPQSFAWEDPPVNLVAQGTNTLWESHLRDWSFSSIFIYFEDKIKEDKIK